MNIDDVKICVIGLGYVGLPLAVEFGKQYLTIGYDIDGDRINALQSGHDHTLEVEQDALLQVKTLSYTDTVEDINQANVYIVTVPTPIDQYKRPDLSPLISASRLVGQVLSKGDVVVYESTVFPGATEEVCVPEIEKASGLMLNSDFTVGYSPERINPGDKTHRITSIKKVTSGSTAEAAQFIDELYASIITAGTHKASSIKVAEAAKVIENTQRDVNIGLINELAMIFNRLGIDTEEVLRAAGTKWNFLPFQPGLVGGHCISVDPYYLTQKAIEVGFHPEMILAGRRVNDGMGAYVVDRVARLMTQKRIHIVDSNILVMGMAFKENCPDMRNTRVIDIVRGFEVLHAHVDVYDPWLDKDAVNKEYGVALIEALNEKTYDAIIVSVPHHQFQDMGAAAIRALGKQVHVMFDVKYIFSAAETDGRL